MLSAADLAFVQSVSALTHTTACQILRRTLTSDGMGGNTTVWNTIATVNCRIAPVVSRTVEQVDQQRIELLSRWSIALPVGQDIDIKDRIVANGITYEVAAFAAPRTLELERVVECEQVQS